MANKFTTLMDMDNSLYKKKIKENEKLDKDYAALAKKVLSGSVNDQSKALKSLNKLGVQRNKGLKEQAALQRQITASMRAQASSNRAELQHRRAVAQLSDKESKKQHSDFRRMMSEFKRSPAGRTMRQGGRALGGAARMGFAGAGMVGGMFVGGVMRGYQNYAQIQQAKASLAGMASPGAIRAGAGRRMGASLGFNAAESAQHQAAMLRATGVAGPREIQQAMRSTGMGAGEAGGVFGAIARGGTSFGTSATDETGVGKGRQSAGGREFQRIMAASVASGLKRGRMPEFMQGVTKLMQEQQKFQVGRVGGGDFAKTLALWGKTGLAGMKGAAGAGLLTQLSQGIRQPGGGDAGKALMLRSMGFGKPGGTTDYYSAEKMREQGATGENVMRVMSQVQQEYGTGQEAALSMRESLGVSLQQAETLLKIYDSNASVEEKQKKIEEEMEKSKSLEKQSVVYLKKTAGKMSHFAGRFDKYAQLGSDWSKEIEALENLQMKALFRISEFIEKIWNAVDLFIKVWRGKQTAADITKAQNLITAEAKVSKAKTHAEWVTAVKAQQTAAQNVTDTKSTYRPGMGLLRKASKLAGFDVGPSKGEQDAASDARKAMGRKSDTNAAVAASVAGNIENLPMGDPERGRYVGELQQKASIRRAQADAINSMAPGAARNAAQDKFVQSGKGYISQKSGRSTSFTDNFGGVKGALDKAAAHQRSRTVIPNLPDPNYIPVPREPRKMYHTDSGTSTGQTTGGKNNDADRGSPVLTLE